LSATFGQILRGARHGFYWYEPLEVFIRFSDEGPNFRVDVVAPEMVPSRLPKEIQSREHYVWESNPEIVQKCKPLKTLRLPLKVWTTFIVDNEGEMVK